MDECTGSLQFLEEQLGEHGRLNRTNREQPGILLYLVV